MPKYFFFDIDGTLLPFGKPVPDSARYAIKAAEALGNKCFIASGRSIAEMPRFDNLWFDGFICSAGATIIIDGKVVYSAHIEREKYNRLFRFLKERGFYILTQTDKATYLSRETSKVFEEELLSHIGRMVELNGLILDENVPEDEPVKKLLFLCREDGYGVNRVKGELDGDFAVVNNTVGLPENQMAELVLKDITKATAIEQVLKFYGADRKDSVAVGDGANDIEMVEYAALGIAMGNSTSKELLSVADYVTSDIEEDGIKNAVFYALSGGVNGRDKEESCL